MADLIHRPRRLRRRERVRALVREARLGREDLVLPLFACPGTGVRREVPSMPGVHNLWVDEIARYADESLELLARTAVSQAEAGADICAPSAMMDGQVGAIRAGLDEAGFDQIAILSYAVKYASAFYGPFREAADSAPAFGDRRAYQMDAANARE